MEPDLERVVLRWLLASLLAWLTLPAMGGEIIEEIVAKVNSEVITKSELERAKVALRQELQQQFQGQTLQLQAAYAEREKDLLRELIDQALLLQRARDMNISVDTEVIKRLDRIRKDMGLNTLDDLERAIAAQGASFEDFKTSIKNNLMTQQVIGREVGSRLQITQERIKKFYEENKQKLERPEQVRIREILVSTEGKEGAGLEAAEKKTKEVLEKIRKGGNFAELAQQYSDGSTAKSAGGDIGYFRRGQMAKEIENVAFSLKKGEVSEPIRTRFGLLLIKVEEKDEAGIPPLAAVEQEIQETLYLQDVQPALRQFLTRLREEAYILVKSGYGDTGATADQNYARLIPVDMSEDELIAPKGKRGRRTWLPPFRRKSK